MVNQFGSSKHILKLMQKKTSFKNNIEIVEFFIIVCWKEIKKLEFDE